MAKEWVRDPAVMFTHIEREAVLLDPRTRRMFDLNRTGTVVWESIEEGVEAAISQVISVFAVDEVTARLDVEALLEQLVEAGLVSRQT